MKYWDFKPFCNGYHEGSKFKPVRFVVEEECDKIELCGCKFTSTAPFCDKKGCEMLKTSVEKKAVESEIIKEK